MGEFLKSYVAVSLAGVLALLLWMASAIYSSSSLLTRLDEKVDHLTAGIEQLPSEADLAKTNGRIDTAEVRMGVMEQLLAKAFKSL